MQSEFQGHGAFELPTTSKAVHAGGDDHSPLAVVFAVIFHFLLGLWV